MCIQDDNPNWAKIKTEKIYNYLKEEFNCQGIIVPNYIYKSILAILEEKC
jgi:hypothetical protein